MIKIVCDLMGADKNAKELVSGPIKALNEVSDLELVICCNEDDIKDELSKLEYDKNRVTIIHCTEEATNNDIPTKIIKQKPNSSLVKALTLCKEDDSCKAYVSCGATGVVLAASIFILGRVAQIRPALACVLMGKKGKVCICDCGANVDCSPENIVNFAKMGVSYMKAQGIDYPRVRLLSNGAEEKKGPEAIKLAHQLLKEAGVNFLGNVEGKDALDGTCDVVCADGFGGNVLIKTIEGTAKTLFYDMLKMAKESNNPDEAKLLQKTVYTLLDKYDYNTKGGAILLGVNKIVLKGHGAGEAETFYNMVLDAYKLAKEDMITDLKNRIQ